MSDEGIFATTAEVQRKVGANASAVSNVEAYINQFMTEAESFINVTCKVNFSDTYATLNADVKGILKRCASCLAAIDVIEYDTTGISSSEAQFRINVLWATAQECLKLLKKKEDTNFMTKA